MAALPSWPLGSAISIYSVAHQADAIVTVTMDNSAYKYQEPDYDWVGGYGVHPLATVPTPAPYYDHKGTDIAKGKGSPIYAISGGTVTVCGGTYHEIYISLDDGTTDCYLHCDIASGVSVGKKINAGDLIAYENGWGASGSSTYGSHLHLDKYVTAVGRGSGTIDAFNYAQNGGSAGKSDVYMKVDDISSWDTGSEKIGLWVGGVVSVKQGAPLFYDVSGSNAVITSANGSTLRATAWVGEFGQNMRTIVSNIVSDKAQVSCYDQLGAFHPQIWVKISDINW